MLRSNAFIASTVLAAAAASSLGAGSDLGGRRTAERSFDALYGAEARRVAATRETADDLAFARKLLDVAVEMGDDLAAQALLCHRAADFALADPGGAALAVEAMEFLGKVQPAVRAAARESLLDRLDRRLAAQPPARRHELAVVYLDRLLDAAERRAAAGDWDAALALCQRAAPVAKALGPEAEAAARTKAKAVSNGQAARRKATELEARLAATPRDPTIAGELARLLVIEFDRPDEAER
jgi:hypothetical protein